MYASGVRSRNIIALFLAMLAPWTAAATTMHRASLNELVRAADLVVLGRAIEHESFWEAGRIKTRTLIELDEVWVGDLPSSTREIEMITLGGVVGTIGQTVHGALQLPPGKRVVVCLARSGDGRLTPVGMGQAAFLVRDDGGPWARVERLHKDLHLVGPAAKPLPETLQELKLAILEASRGR